MTKHSVLDLFAGTGVGVACKTLGVPEYGVEVWGKAIESRTAARMTTIYRDAWDVHKAQGYGFDTIWASPPCQTFSTAGSGSGRRALDRVVHAIRARVWESANGLRALSDEVGDPRTALVLIPLTYAHLYKPKYLVLEQVPTVLPVWDEMAKPLRDQGYSFWTGIIDASDYGVPQTRKRAYLIARRDGGVAGPPEKTRGRVTMHESLGWGLTNRPSPTLTSHLGVTRSPSGTQRVYLGAIERGEFVFRPGTPKHSKVATNGIGSKYAPNTVNVTTEEGAVLQSYTPGISHFRGLRRRRICKLETPFPRRLRRRYFMRYGRSIE